MANSQIDNFIESFGDKDFELAYIFAKMSAEINNRINNTDEKLMAIEKEIDLKHEVLENKIKVNEKSIKAIEEKMKANKVIFSTLRTIAIVIAGLLTVILTILEIRKAYEKNNQRNSNQSKMVDPGSNRIDTLAN